MVAKYDSVLNQLFLSKRKSNVKDGQRLLSVVPGIAGSPFGYPVWFQEEPQYVRPPCSFLNIYDVFLQKQ